MRPTKPSSKTTQRAGVQRTHSSRYRAVLYSVLAQALSAPNQKLCEAVEDEVLLGLVCHAVDELPAGYLRGLDLSFLNKLYPRSGKGIFADALLAEYTRLFSLNLHCPQYEADYLTRNSHNSVHVIAGISSLYATFGVEVAPGVAERPDQIAVELDFMHLLAAKEANATGAGKRGNLKLFRRAQKLFFGSHLAKWGAAFAHNLREESHLEFYQGISSLMETLMHAEARWLGVELGNPLHARTVEPSVHGSRKDNACGCSELPLSSSDLSQIITPVQEPARGKE